MQEIELQHANMYLRAKVNLPSNMSVIIVWVCVRVCVCWTGGLYVVVNYLFKIEWCRYLRTRECNNTWVWCQEEDLPIISTTTSSQWLLIHIHLITMMLETSFPLTSCSLIIMRTTTLTRIKQFLSNLCKIYVYIWHIGMLLRHCPILILSLEEFTISQFRCVYMYSRFMPVRYLMHIYTGCR